MQGAYARLCHMTQKTFLALVVAIFLAQVARAEEAYFNVLLDWLKFTQGTLPTGTISGSREVRSQQWPALAPYAVIDGGGEAYVHGVNIQPWAHSGLDLRNGVLAIRAHGTAIVTGRLFVPRQDF